VPAVLLPHEANYTPPFGISKRLTGQYLFCQQRKMHCWIYFAIRIIWLVGLVKRQKWYTWI